MGTELQSELQIVSLDCPYDHWDHPLNLSLFPHIVGLKLIGYQKEYPYGVLPIDTSDFVSTHNIVCRRSGKDLIPLMGYKTIARDRCDLFGIPFPPLTVLRTSGATRHEEALQRILDDCAAKKQRVAYGSSWTINPEIRKWERSLTHLLKDLMTVMLVSHHFDSRTDIQIGCGVLKVKTDHYFQKIGYIPLTSRGETLPPFGQASLLGEPVIMMQCPRFSDSAMELVERHRALWNNRIIVCRAPSQNQSSAPLPKAA